jgi:hypothetical protein
MALECSFPPAEVEISGVTISGGSASGGGGIQNKCALTVRGVIMKGNSAQGADGGAINSPNLVPVNIIDSTLTGNGAQTGGAVYVAGTLNMTNSTVSGNTHADYFGAAVTVTGQARITNSTITGNPRGVAGGPSVEIHNSIVAANTTSNCIIVGGATSLGHNLSSDASCPFNGPGDLNSVEPQLTGLQENGGPTPTHGLYPNSPAIDGGDNAGCPATDQRGVARPQGAACDIGAYEYVVPTTRPPTAPPDTPPPAPPAPTQTTSPTLNISSRASPSPSPSPIPSAAPSSTRLASRAPTFTPTLIDAPPEEEVVTEGVPVLASGLAAVGALGLVASMVGGGYYWYRARRRRRR